VTASGSGTLSWYTAANGGAFLGAGGSLATGSLSADQVYYAQDSTCTASVRTAIQVTVADAINTALVVNANSLTAVESGATYQWVDCLNGSVPILNATAQTYNAPVSGSYAVIITVNACADTSVCEAIITTALDGPEGNANVLVFPNPAQRVLNILINTPGPSELTLFDASGRAVRVVQSARQLALFNVEDLQRGWYVLKVRSAGYITAHPIVLE
jgi:hypothetical protein